MLNDISLVRYDVEDISPVPTETDIIEKSTDESQCFFMVAEEGFEPTTFGL